MTDFMDRLDDVVPPWPWALGLLAIGGLLVVAYTLYGYSVAAYLGGGISGPGALFAVERVALALWRKP